MFADRAKFISVPEKAGMDMQVSGENCMCQTADRTEETAEKAEM